MPGTLRILPQPGDELMARLGNSDLLANQHPLAELSPAGLSLDSPPIDALSIADEPKPAGGSVAYPQGASVAGSTVPSDTNINDGAAGIPPPAMIPLPAGVWTGLAALGALLSLGRRRSKLI
jgi:hypothetical protein